MNYEAQRNYVNEQNPFMVLCGITVTQVSADHAIAELMVRPEDLNPGGTLHGGSFYTLADAVATTAARTDGHRYATIDGSIRYHRSIKTGRVTAAAHVRHRGRTLCAVSVEITDDHGQLLADANFSIFRLEPIDHPAFQSES